MILEKNLNRCIRLFWFIVALIIRNFSKVKNNQIFCWSYHFSKYSCNPKAITEYILENVPDDFEIYWAFDSKNIPKELDNRIRVVVQYNFKYLVALYTSKFIITNSRNNKYDSMFIKKKNQKYIMTWHGSIGNKPIEKDAIETLGNKYKRIAIEDSSMCDLMLSNCKRFTNQIRDAFWYKGEILEKCIPRNDLFYNHSYILKIYEDVRNELGFTPETKIVLYAPTYRGNNNSLEFYHINWDFIIPHLEKLLGNSVEVLVKLHPNMSHVNNIGFLTHFEHVHDITQVADIQRYLFAANVMISDYSSTMFDFALLRRPCFTFAVDRADYERGFYFTLEQLPFPIAESNIQLANCIRVFKQDKYIRDINNCFDNTFGLDEDGHACERLLAWMRNN